MSKRFHRPFNKIVMPSESNSIRSRSNIRKFIVHAYLAESSHVQLYHSCCVVQASPTGNRCNQQKRSERGKILGSSERQRHIPNRTSGVLRA